MAKDNYPAGQILIIFSGLALLLLIISVIMRSL